MIKRAIVICSNELCVNPDHLINGDYERFMLSFTKTDCCWIWNKELDKDDYGTFRIHNKGKIKNTRATHYSLLIFKKIKVPSKMMACHTCDNPKCINPDHLFIGNAKINALDMCIKERSKSTLTSVDVLEIRELAKTMKINDIAKKFNLSYSCICYIVLFKRWKHL